MEHDSKEKNLKENHPQIKNLRFIRIRPFNVKLKEPTNIPGTIYTLPSEEDYFYSLS